MTNDTILKITGLTKHFKPTLFGRGPVVPALEDVSFEVPRGKVVGLVGESGSGKTTIGRTVLRLVEPTRGEVLFNGDDLTTFSKREIRRKRAQMQYIFQDPFASLSPRMTVGQILTEGLEIQRMGSREDRTARAAEALDAVDLPRSSMERYAHEFSGGQRQRIGIARALALGPELIVADEPVSALDVSIQAQVVNLLKRLQAELNLSMIFISHDLAVVEYLCDFVVVLYLGRVMEMGPSEEIYANPSHPYTRALLSAVPSLDLKRKTSRQLLKGDIPSPSNPPSGCVFRTRCPMAIDACAQAIPPFREVAKGHKSACIRIDELSSTQGSSGAA